MGIREDYRNGKINSAFKEKKTPDLSTIKDMSIEMLLDVFFKDVDEFKKCVSEIKKLDKNDSAAAKWVTETKEALSQVDRNSKKKDIVAKLQLAVKVSVPAKSTRLIKQQKYWLAVLKRLNAYLNSEEYMTNKEFDKAAAMIEEVQNEKEKRVKTREKMSSNEDVTWEEVKESADVEARKLYVSCVKKFGKIGENEKKFLRQYFTKDGKSFTDMVIEGIRKTWEKTASMKSLRTYTDGIKNRLVEHLGEEKGRALLIGKWTKWLKKFDPNVQLRLYVGFNRWLNSAPLENLRVLYSGFRKPEARKRVDKKENTEKILEWLKAETTFSVWAKKPVEPSQMVRSFNKFLANK